MPQDYRISVGLGGNVILGIAVIAMKCRAIRHLSYGATIHQAAGILPSDFHLSEDCNVIAVSFPDSMVYRETIKNSYGVIGHLSLLQNLVIKLSEDDFISCRDDLIRLHAKLKKPHLFKEEIIGTLLKAHVLDLYNIHAQTQPEFNEGGRPTVLLRDFIEMLLEGKFREHRTIPFYANRLCVNPHGKATAV